MYRHFTDPNGPNGIVDSDIRLDIPSVRKLISTGGVGKTFFIIIFLAIEFFYQTLEGFLEHGHSYLPIPISLVQIASCLPQAGQHPYRALSGDGGRITLRHNFRLASV